MTRTLALMLIPMLLTGCDLSMKQQAKAEPQSSPELWPAGPPRQPPPPGTVAEGALAEAKALATPPPLTPALIDRGQDRYGIFCAVCHGRTGDGDGPVVEHGFPAPPSYHIARLVAAPPAYIVDVITHGHGVMYSYADRVAPADRWAIAAYVKTLQRARLDEEARR
ncbi:MAG TPA: cytochrome c [Sphingomonas sp.]|nr:cytochrome c [Sphingomonas sp.]